MEREIRRWMMGQCSGRGFEMTTDFESATQLAEAAADALDIDSALDDETHPIWDIALDVWEMECGPII